MVFSNERKQRRIVVKRGTYKTFGWGWSLNMKRISEEPVVCTGGSFSPFDSHLLCSPSRTLVRLVWGVHCCQLSIFFLLSPIPCLDFLEPWTLNFLELQLWFYDTCPSPKCSMPHIYFNVLNYDLFCGKTFYSTGAEDFGDLLWLSWSLLLITNPCLVPLLHSVNFLIHSASFWAPSICQTLCWAPWTVVNKTKKGSHQRGRCMSR